MLKEHPEWGDANFVLKIVALHFGISIKDLVAATPHRSTGRPRAIAVYLMRKHFLLSLTDIGEAINCDSKRALQHFAWIGTVRKKNPELDKDILAIESFIKVRTPTEKYEFSFITKEKKEVTVTVSIK